MTEKAGVPAQRPGASHPASRTSRVCVCRGFRMPAAATGFGARPRGGLWRGRRGLGGTVGLRRRRRRLALVGIGGLVGWLGLAGRGAAAVAGRARATTARRGGRHHDRDAQDASQPLPCVCRHLRLLTLRRGQDAGYSAQVDASVPPILGLELTVPPFAVDVGAARANGSTTGTLAAAKSRRLRVATVSGQGLTVATRNRRDFAAAKVPIVEFVRVSGSHVDGERGDSEFKAQNQGRGACTCAEYPASWPRR